MRTLLPHALALALAPLWGAEQPPSVVSDSLPIGEASHQLPWVDSNGVRRVGRLTLEEMMALMDVSAKQPDRITAIFELKERLLEVQVAKSRLMRQWLHPGFDQVLWQRLCREHRRLVDALAVYHQAIEHHRERRIHGDTPPPRRPEFYRPTGDPARDREYVLGPAAGRPLAPQP